MNEHMHEWMNAIILQEKDQEPNKQKYQEQEGKETTGQLQHSTSARCDGRILGILNSFSRVCGRQNHLFPCFTKNTIWLFCSTDACTGDTEAMEGWGGKNAGPSAGIKQLQQTVLVASESHRKENKKPVHIRTPFNETVKIIHLIKSQPLNTDPFNILCEKLLYP